MVMFKQFAHDELEERKVVQEITKQKKNQSMAHTFAIVENCDSAL